MANSKRQTRRGKGNRPPKPYANFPLTPHASGAWMKKIGGRVFYFGRWANRVNGKLVRIDGDGWQDALALYQAQAADLHAGRTPRTTTGLTIAILCNHFLTAKLRRLQAGEITQRTLTEYRQFTDRIIAAFGKQRIGYRLGWRLD